MAENTFTIEVCSNHAELAAVKKLDDLIFGQHQCISNDLLKAIFLQGGLLLCKINKRIVAESQVLFESAAGQTLENQQTALFYGTAVLPDFRRQNIGKSLAQAQEKLALSKGKIRAVLSVRPENAESINLRQKMDFSITSWQENYYGSGRLIMEKWLVPLPPGAVKQPKQTIKSVVIKIGDKIDTEARAQLSQLTQIGLRPQAYHITHASEAIIDFSA
jgi:GNAT superfamily N-acetyltransferase